MSPFTGRIRFVETSRKEEQKAAGAGIEESQRFFTFLPPDDARAQLVSAVAERLLKVVKSTRGAVPWNWHISIVDDDSTQSIVHLGGGKILVFTGILDWVQHDENRLAALLAHEFAHASARHFAEAKWRRHTFSSTPRYRFYLSPREFPADMIDEGTNDFGFELPYWKEQEEEADLISLRILRLAGYETDTYSAVLEKFLEEKSRIRYSQDIKATSLTGYVVQHPVDERRVANLKLWVKE
ncbi:hypothetical protein M427DRAFT_32395 [Gonapodya prolifera JEL478]|uniref:Peptidase M48 domain-containing protein n=1 Tax=Gonapodya prolifera (strain JEL478) TaxID=1344416 RepID=A0A139AF54_GONPJ|nr:hypothetical protein M427DRAFT_32395 [Gonapodya prolifera JEL478]|eukprot:KXS15446.1 hypothetical protein M427DRAFT_32395 [Gonapodya prolifera JEL478]